jgi:hypothetical protein
MADPDDVSDVSIDSNLEWELDQGIPQPEDPFISKYYQGREALIEQEKKQRHGKFTLPFFPSLSSTVSKPTRSLSQFFLPSLLILVMQMHSLNPHSPPSLNKRPKPSAKSAAKN